MNRESSKTTLLESATALLLRWRRAPVEVDPILWKETDDWLKEVSNEVHGKQD